MHLMEIHEQPWCPAFLRNGATDILRLTADVFGTYRPIVPHLVQATEEMGTRRIVDLCAGGGGPWRSLLRRLPASIEAVLLTDFFPNLPAFARAAQDGDGRLAFHSTSVDATDVPSELEGFRTIFTAFHHFGPEQARAILADAAHKGVGIGVFEITRRTPGVMAFVGMGVPLAAALLTPLARPMSLGRLVLTYVLPVIPAVLAIDGVISCLRTYSVHELQELVDSIDAPDYTWHIGVARGLSPLPITYLVGHPHSPTETRAS